MNKSSKEGKGCLESKNQGKEARNLNEDDDYNDGDGNDNDDSVGYLWKRSKGVN